MDLVVGRVYLCDVRQDNFVTRELLRFMGIERVDHVEHVPMPDGRQWELRGDAGRCERWEAMPGTSLRIGLAWYVEPVRPLEAGADVTEDVELLDAVGSFLETSGVLHATDDATGATGRGPR